VKLVQAALRRRLEEVLKGLTLRTEHCQPFTLQDLFPEEEREKEFDAADRPQVRAKEDGANIKVDLFFFLSLSLSSSCLLLSRLLFSLSLPIQALLFFLHVA
jgi:hypothetical protein